MKLAFLPRTLRPGKMQYAPRLAPKLGVESPANLVLGAPGREPFSLEDLRAIAACESLYQAARAPMLLLLVAGDARPWLVRQERIMTAEFGIAAGTPLDVAVRRILYGLAGKTPDLVMDDATLRFIHGGPLFDVKDKVRDLASFLGEILDGRHAVVDHDPSTPPPAEPPAEAVPLVPPEPEPETFGSEPASPGLYDPGLYQQPDFSASVSERPPSQNMPILILPGVALVGFGLIDLIGSYGGVDVWGQWIGVDLPEAIWSVTAWIEMGLGSLLFKMGTGAD